jgi:hypothetical protein
MSNESEIEAASHDAAASIRRIASARRKGKAANVALRVPSDRR